MNAVIHAATRLVLAWSCCGNLAVADNWSATEIHFQYGELDQAFAGGSADTTTLTVQHAGLWRYFDDYFFVDLSATESTHNQDRITDAYAEFYIYLSAAKIFDRPATGLLKDVALITGLNVSVRDEIIKYLPGVRFALAIPGFQFANLDVMAYIDDSRGDIRQGDSYQFNFNWKYPFNLGPTRWSFEGYVEMTSSRSSEHRVFGAGKAESWVLSQTQLRLDLGDVFFNKAHSLYAGVEFQYWHNKLGVDGANEYAPQLLLVWAF